MLNKDNLDTNSLFYLSNLEILAEYSIQMVQKIWTVSVLEHEFA